MDVTIANAITPTHPDSRKNQHGREPSSESTDQQKSQDPPADSWQEAAVNIDQSLVGAFTPEVQTIIDTLTREIEPLRRRLEAAEQRSDELKELNTKHAFLDIPNRREIIRELEHALAHKEDLSFPPVLVLLHVVNADQVRAVSGRQGLDQYLTEICHRLSEAINPTDAFGSLCGNDLALLVLGMDFNQANEFTDKIVAKICSDPILLDGNPVSVELKTGLAELRYVSDASTAISIADQNMSSKTSNS